MIASLRKPNHIGDLVYRLASRNFNPIMATAATVTIAEVEEIVEVGALDPDHIVTPNIFVQRVVKGEVDARWTCRAQMAQRAAQELQNGFAVNFGIGIPTLVANYVPPGWKSSFMPKMACSAVALWRQRAKRMPI